MPKHRRLNAPAHPWRKTARTTFQAAVMLAAIAPGLYEAATEHDSAAATGWAASGLAIAGAVTRVMALPVVERFLRRFVPFLAAGDVQAEDVIALQVMDGPALHVVAGEAAMQPTGSTLPVGTTVGELGSTLRA